ncbi:MAG: VCBS repeat-containing protein, partial [Planctomycetes bacterium]|nr:VCBS repeat-containing protein [Planctomycetota bacterium]
ACDWDRDGDLDLVLGNMYGKVFLARNASGDKSLALRAPEPLRVAGAPLELTQTNASPCVADWDGDGALDLVLGLGDGSVRLYRNTTASGEPVLAASLELVAASPEGRAELRLARPGPRARPCVADWNEDGRLDLVLGEHSGEDGAAPKLDQQQQQALQASLEIGLELGLRRGELERAALTRWLEGKHIPLDEASQHYDVFLAEWLQTDEAIEIAARQQEQAALQRRLNPALIEHGRVWVFLRKPEEG